MFVDAHQVQDGEVLRSTVCIIGGGVAGITLALELEKKNIDTCLLESGGFKPDNKANDLNRGENIGVRYEFADGFRFRQLGGGSNAWGGWCGPWDDWDFEQRSWVPHSGWPFGPEELEPFWNRTHQILQLGPRTFDPEYWVQSISRPEVRRMPLTTGRLRDCISQFSPPTRFGDEYREHLKAARRVRVLLNANVINIESEPVAKMVRRVEAKTLSGRKLYIEAEQYVLAAGGIENARLLLASNKVLPGGLGNGNGLVGRFFMDNPRLLRHRVRLNDNWDKNHLYDIKFHHRRRSVVKAGKTRVASQFALTEQVQKEEGLLNGRLWFSSAFKGEETEGAKALYRRKQSLLTRGDPDWSLTKDLATMLSSPVDTIAYGVTRLVRVPRLVNHINLQMVIEQSPNPDSRVLLSNDKDALGVPRVRIDWRLGDLEARTFNRSFLLLAEELRRNGCGEVDFDSEIDSIEWPQDIEGTWHHMGTTRMHDSPRLGVVNRDCRLHESKNLYVAGSSVFPTAGPNYPTMLIVALTLRLADHLSGLPNRDPGEVFTSSN